MSDKSSIEWTEATWNPVTGCNKISPGCAHCYAETLAERFRGVPGHPFEHGFDVQLRPEKLTLPLTWKKPRRIFVNSMSDLFHDAVPDEYIDRVFAVMAVASQHTFQVLTKRPARMRAYIAAREPLFGFPWPLAHIWLGVSVENQHWARERIPILLQTPAAVRFLSCEPLLGPVDLGQAHADQRYPGIDWVIVGGESGPKARRMELEWALSLVRQCQSARVPVFVKQLGKHHALRGDPKGHDLSRWPEDLRVREFPPLPGVVG
jgi:protein gp37